MIKAYLQGGHHGVPDHGAVGPQAGAVGLQAGAVGLQAGAVGPQAGLGGAVAGMSVSGLCATLGVSRSWFYEQPRQLKRVEEDLNLRDLIEEIVLEFPGYGYRSVTAQLHRQGEFVNHKRVLRVMRQECLLYQIKRKFCITTDSQHSHRVYQNLVKELELTGPNQVWVADITYIRLPTCFCYLACILDAYSRVCVGWHLSKEINTQLTLAALEKAIVLRQPSAGLIHHSDRGVQYASDAYVARLEELAILPSMSAKGNPYDNAKAESFFKTLKRDEVYLKDYTTFDEAEQNLGSFINDVYNCKRLHSSLGYRPPLEFERDHHRGEMAKLQTV